MANEGLGGRLGNVSTVHRWDGEAGKDSSLNISSFTMENVITTRKTFQLLRQKHGVIGVLHICEQNGSVKRCSMVPANGERLIAEKIFAFADMIYCQGKSNPSDYKVDL